MNGSKKKANRTLDKQLINLKNINFKNNNVLKILLYAFLVVIIVVSCIQLKPLFYSSSIKKVRSWNVSEDYNLGVAAKDAMKHVKWKQKKENVILTGKDRKSKDEIVITFKVGESMSFVSMTRNGRNLEYYDWEHYMRSYKEK